LLNVDVLALEFNHDENMEKASGRAESLIRRVLGDHGHLSNDQAAELLAEVLARSAPRRLQHLVQLHPSQQCNRPKLAQAVARKVFRDHDPTIQVHTAKQARPGAWLTLSPPSARKMKKEQMAFSDQQPWLPGWDV
jgi:hypothetical protein